MLHFPVCLEILVRYNTILSSLLPRYTGSTLHPPTKVTRITSTGVSSAIQTLNLEMRKVAPSNLQPVNKQHVQHDVNTDKFNTHTHAYNLLHKAFCTVQLLPFPSFP